MHRHVRIRRFVIGLAAAMLLLVGVAAVGWQVFGLAYVESRLKQELAEQGYPVRSLTLRAAGLSRAELVDLELVNGTTIESIEVDYRLTRLVRQRRIDRLMMTGLRLDLDRLAQTRDRDDTEAGRTAVRPQIQLPVDAIVLRDGQIAVGTPLGAIELGFGLEEETQADGGIVVAGAMTVRGESGEIATPISGYVAPDGAFELTAAPEAGRLDWRGSVLQVNSGSLAASGTIAALDRVDVTLDARLVLPDGLAADLDAVAGLGAGRLAFEVGLATVDDREGAVLTGAVQEFAGPAPTYEMDLTGDLRLLDRIAALFAAEAVGVDEGRLTARLSGRWTRPQSGMPQSLDGRVLVLGHGGMASGDTGTVSLTADYAVTDDRIRMTGEPAILVEWSRPDRDEATTLRLGQGSDPFDVSMARVGRGWTATVAGPYSLQRGSSLAGGGIDLTASLDETTGALAGPVAAEFDVSGVLADGVAVVGAEVGLDGVLAITDGHWQFQPYGCIALAIRSLEFLRIRTAAEGLSGCVSALPGQPLLAVPPGGPKDATVAAAIRIDPGTLVLGAEMPEAIRVDFALPEATVTAAPGADGFRADVTIADASLALSEPGLVFDGIDIAAVARFDGTEPLRLRLDSVTVRSPRTPAWFAPLSVAGRSVMTGDGAVEFEGSVSGAAGAIAATVQGRHETASGAGRLDLRLDPVPLTPGILQPADLAPVLESVPISDVLGSIAGAARFAWGERLTSSGELDLEDVTLTLGGAVIRSIDGQLRADSLLPLILPDGQLLALGGAEFGVVLEEGALAFGVAGDGRLSVQGMGFGLAGGSLAVEPFQAVPGDAELPLVVAVQGVDLGLLSEQFPIGGLTISGRIDGRVPLRLEEDMISVENGVLQSTEAGVIRYVPALPIGPKGEGGLALLLDAVGNFRYETMGATVNGRTGEDLEVVIRLSGANPDLYGGLPVALNINLSGNLDEILRSGLTSLGITDEAGDLRREE